MSVKVLVEKPKLTFWQIWNMSFGFLGIQFGFALQNANVSRIFETLGAKVDDIPILWIFAPLAGLLVQPLIGYMSDNTWGRLGRRKPYFLLGAILSSFALFIMPNSSVLWMAAGCLLILDASINISMEPFRALVGDMLPSSQRTVGFAMQSFFIGLGAVIASALPYLLHNVFGMSNTAGVGEIPETVKYSFYLGSIVFLAAVLWTVGNTKEYPPEQFESYAAQEMVEEKGSFIKDVLSMPKTMKQLAIVQFFTWIGLFAMWIYTTSAVTSSIYGTTDTTSAAYNEGADWVGVCFAAYNGFAAVMAFLLPMLAKSMSRKQVHAISLLAGGIGLISVFFINDPKLLLVSMLGVGLAWSSILSMPYAILAGSLPVKKMGFFMGVFNFFIVIPQIISAVLLGYLTKHVFGGHAIYTLVLGGGLMILASLLVLFVDDVDEAK
ncbi:MFS transporter [Solitalea sp. MAHUQ-68]|uniref:MFS transporter n=1 Tax=Solitalea agri TaxID=2953739 RepID=A0A9X2EZJ5_9SPHI|nr:MFS transporter [Solitalea agri]MCO4291456.1 MFS transporter [Solitalea agri]